jgi:hypothetical protein
VLAPVLILVVLGVSLAVLLWAGTLWFQGYIYSEPVAQVWWRAPAAALALTLFLALWCFLDYRNPGDYPGQFQFRTGDDKQLPELWALREGRETQYKMRKSDRGLPEYVDRATGRPWQSHPDAIIIEETPGEKVEFKAERDKNGNFKIERGKLRYLDPKGRVMTEEQLGRLDISRRGLVFGNILLNLGHLLVWFAVLWLLLRFQWSHALGLAVVFWLIMTFTILHIILLRTEEAGRGRSVPGPAPAASSPAVRVPA